MLLRRLAWVYAAGVHLLSGVAGALVAWRAPHVIIAGITLIVGFRGAAVPQHA
jgi:hypothetical protein